jgi:hypothetical protein
MTVPRIRTRLQGLVGPLAIVVIALALEAGKRWC